MKKGAPRIRLQAGPQPPPTYTSRGSVPDGYVTWASRKQDIEVATLRGWGLYYPYLREQAGTIRFGRLLARPVVRGFVSMARHN